MSSKKGKASSKKALPPQYRGVSKRRKRFKAEIYFNGKTHSCGTYDTPKEAALAYDRAVVQHKRPTSYLNFPNGPPFDAEEEKKNKKRKLHSTNTTGFNGVTRTGTKTGKTKFQAQIRMNKRIKYLGTYETAKEAALHYDRAAIQQKFKSSKLNFPDGLPLDDEDYDELMNPKKRKLSSANTTGYRGVVKIGKRFQAQIFSGKKREYLGTYDDPKEAAHAYDRAAIKHKLPSHKLNFPPESTSSDEDDEDNSGKKSGAAVDDGNDDEATHELSPFSPAHLPFQGDPMLDQLVAAVEAQTKQSK